VIRSRPSVVPAFTLAFALACSHHAPPAPTSAAPAAAGRPAPDIAALLARMTLDEKLGQMTQIDRNALGAPSDITEFFLGSILNGGNSLPTPNTARTWADGTDEFQRAALATRLAIPILYGTDAVHGDGGVSGAVIFPHNIGLGCTRDPALVEKVARTTALEMAGAGADWTFAPCIAVPRDERWGRTYEGFGESPELAVTLGPAAVKGFQADGAGVLACAKHFLADGGTARGKDQGDAVISEAELRAIHLPGYAAAIRAGVGSVMISYSSWNGVPMHMNRRLITDVLKGELGFDGFVVTDWEALNKLPGDYAEEVEAGINAGIDMVMVPNNFRDFITTMKELVAAGRASGCGSGRSSTVTSPPRSARPPTARSPGRPFGRAWCCSRTSAARCRSPAAPGSTSPARARTTSAPSAAAGPSDGRGRADRRPGAPRSCRRSDAPPARAASSPSPGTPPARTRPAPTSTSSSSARIPTPRARATVPSPS
jgi:beta-glucosidase